MCVDSRRVTLISVDNRIGLEQAGSPIMSIVAMIVLTALSLGAIALAVAFIDPV